VYIRQEMPKHERQAEILRIVRSRGQVTCQELADEFDVKVLTIKRDLTDMMPHHPIITTQGRNGGVSMMWDYTNEHANILTLKQNQALQNAIKKAKGEDREYLIEILETYGKAVGQ